MLFARCSARFARLLPSKSNGVEFGPVKSSLSPNSKLFDPRKGSHLMTKTGTPYWDGLSRHNWIWLKLWIAGRCFPPEWNRVNMFICFFCSLKVMKKLIVKNIRKQTPAGSDQLLGLCLHAQRCVTECPKKLSGGSAATLGPGSTWRANVRRECGCGLRAAVQRLQAV